MRQSRRAVLSLQEKNIEPSDQFWLNASKALFDEKWADTNTVHLMIKAEVSTQGRQRLELDSCHKRSLLEQSFNEITLNLSQNMLA